MTSSCLAPHSHFTPLTSHFPMPTLHAFGEILIDAVPAGTTSLPPFELPRLTLVPGGAPANVAAQVARLGARARLLGGVSTDPWGALLTKALVTLGVDTSGLVSLPNPTALAIVQLSESGDRSFRFFRNDTADLAVHLDQLDFAGIRPGDAAHACSNCMTVEPARSIALASLAEAKKRGALISVDPNLRPMLWQDGRVDAAAIWKLLSLADLVKAGVEEADELAGGVAPFVSRCLTAGAKVVVISDGPGALRAFTANGSFEAPTPRVQAVDTTGAGDALCGGLLYPLLAEGDAGAALARRIADPDALREWLRFASACGALTVTKPDAMSALPDLAAVERLLADGK